MTNTRIVKLTQIAIITALSLVLGRTFQFSMAVGFFTLLDVGIYLAAFRFGKKEGAVVGALSGFLIDLISGYPQYMLISLFAHGVQGYFAGFTGKNRPIGLVLATIAMVSAYLVADVVFAGGVLVKIFSDRISIQLLYKGFGAAMSSVFGNVIQTVIGAGVGFILSRVLEKRFL